MHHISRRQGLSSFSASRRRMVSREMLSCSVNLTISPANSSSVQRDRPFGAPLQAVATSSEQQAMQSLHRARQGFVVERTAQANQIRGLLNEFGIVIPKGN